MTEGNTMGYGITSLAVWGRELIQYPALIYVVGGVVIVLIVAAIYFRQK